MPSSSKPLPPNAEDLVFGCLESPEPEKALEDLCQERPEGAEALRAIFDGLQRHGLLNRSGDHSETRGRSAAGHPEKLGPYRILEKLGHGGMGVVFLGLDEDLGRKVAIKLIRPEQLYVPGNKARFKREVDALLDLSHSGIVKVLGAGEDQGIPYYAMEFVEGLSLAEVIQALDVQSPSDLEGHELLGLLEKITHEKAPSSSGTRLTDELARLSWPDVCIRMASEAAEALQHAHEQLIVHRDVKPSNLLLTKTGHLRLVDFGLARIEDGQSLTGSTAELGSLPYMPPEFLGGGADRLDPRQDVYSLGVTLYELLTLHCPYLGANQEETRRLILEANPPDPRKLNPKISWDLATVCLTAMDPDPSRRYQTCADFLQDLSNLRARRSIVATRPKPLLRMRRWGERHPRASAVAATGLLLLLLSGFLYGIWESKARRQIESLYEQARYLNYIANIRTAKMDISTNEVADGKFRLLSCPEDLRGIEWNILNRRMDQSRRILSMGTFPIVDLSVSDDGQLLASVDLNGRVQLIRLLETRHEETPELPGRYFRLGFLTKNHQLALGRADGAVIVYDIDKKQMVAELPPTRSGSGRVNTFLPLPDLGFLAVGYADGWMDLWDIQTQKPRFSRRIHTSAIYRLSANAESTLLLSASVDKTVKLLTLPDLVEKTSVQHETWAMAAAFSKKGKAFLSGSQIGCVIETSIASGLSQQVTPGRVGHSFSMLTFIPHRREFVAGRVAVVSKKLDGQARSHEQLGHQSSVLCMDLGPSAESVFTGSEDGTIREWGVESTGILSTLADVGNAIRAVGWMDTQRWIAGNSKGKLLRGTLHGSSGPRVQTLKGGGILDLVPITREDFAVSTADAGLWFFRWDQEQPYHSLTTESPIKTMQVAAGSILALTQDGRILEIGRIGNQWSARALGFKTKVSTMALAEAQRLIFWAGEDGILRSTDLDGGETRVPLVNLVGVKKIRPLDGGTRVSIEDIDHVIRVLDAQSGEISHKLEGHTRELDSVKMLAGSNRLVSSGKHERKLMIWDAEHETRLLSIDLPHSSLDMALDPSGQKILIGLMWGYVTLCDASPIERPLVLTRATRSTPEPIDKK